MRARSWYSSPSSLLSLANLAHKPDGRTCPNVDSGFSRGSPKVASLFEEAASTALTSPCQLPDRHPTVSQPAVRGSGAGEVTLGEAFKAHMDICR